MRIGKIKIVSIMMFKELIRDKIFLSLSGASIVLVLASLILNEMVVGQQIKATKDLGLSVLNFFSLFLLIFLGVNLVSRDINNKSLYFLFSKPVNRSEYLVGGSFSILAAVFCGILVITGTIFLLSYLQGEVWLSGLLSAGYFTLLEMTVLLAFAIFFVLITSPQLAMFLTLLTYVIGHTIHQAAQILEQSANVGLKYFVVIIDALLPNLEYFNKKTEIVYNLDIPPAYYLNATLYALGYTLVLFLVASRVFKRKEL
ncbi:MAG: ABC transporter permease subunit [bacterium]|nr:ABC transporter permease subunit [bacterium]